MVVRVGRAWMGGVVALQAMVTASFTAAAKNVATSFFPAAAQLAAFAKLHPTVITVAIGIGVAATVAAAIIVWKYDPHATQANGQRTFFSWLSSPRLAYGSMMVATVSTLALVALVGILVVRPRWCPESLCPPTLAAVVGPHDAYLGADVIAIESGAWVISGDPAGYSLANLPLTDARTAIPALQIIPANQPANAAPAPPYRVVVNVHSLRADLGDISIESVSLVVSSVSLPGRTNVWVKPAPVDYTKNPFQARYAGQPAASFVEASFAGTPAFGQVSLKPGETDSLSIAITSTVSAAITFQIRLEYRYVGEPDTHVFVVPYRLQAAFVDLPDWYEYQLRNGKLEAS